MSKRVYPFLLILAADFQGACGSANQALGQASTQSCTEGERRCDGQQHQVCTGGQFRSDLECDASEQCDANQLCVGRNDCGSSADLIYTVDDTGRLLSFNPRHDLNHFYEIGTLQCPAGTPLSGSGPATPFSMSVDRKARAWVSYSSGEIFAVSTADGSCQRTTRRSGEGGFTLFGMGFVADAAGQQDETLYIAGIGDGPGDFSAPLGMLDTSTMHATSIAALPAWQQSPELTGTGAGELFGYFPGVDRSQVAKIDKQTGSFKQSWSLAGLGGDVSSWAFAHWGGNLYIFVSAVRQGGVVNQVIRFNPIDGQSTVIIPDSPFQIVGAGVSTCAPVIAG